MRGPFAPWPGNPILTQRNLDRGRAGLSGGFSLENDYLAGYGSVDGEMHFNEKNTTLAGSLGFSIDTIEPTDGGTEARPRPLNRSSNSSSGNNRSRSRARNP